MSFFTVDEKKCRRDGICVAVCPLSLIELKDNSLVPTPTPEAEERCVKCGHCVAVCPQGALSLAAIKPEDCPPVRNDLALNAGQVEHFFRSRRSIRTYRNEEVDQKMLANLIDVARYAPTGVNSQQVGWIVINSREKVKNLAGMMVDLARRAVADQNPLAKTFRLADAVNAWESGRDRFLRGAPALVIAHAPASYPIAQVDCTIALSYLELAAPVFGLGCCWAGYLSLMLHHFPQLLQALDIPEGRGCFGIMMIGYPKYKYYRLPPRNQPVIEWR